MMPAFCRIFRAQLSMTIGIRTSGMIPAPTPSAMPIISENRSVVSGQYGQTWAAEFIGLLREIHTEIGKVRPASDTLPSLKKARSGSRYDHLIEEGPAANPPPEKPAGRRGKTKQSPQLNLLNRLKTKKSEVLRFMYDFRVPSDNNQAERDIRMVRVKQKVSGSFRTQDGADIFCKIRGYIPTAKKNAFNVIEAVQRASEGNPFVPTLA